MLSKATVLTRFHEIANSPRKQLDGYLAQGKKVIACVPVYTPEEIIHSMGLVPMGAWGGDIEVKEAKQYFPAFICSVMQSVLELGMRGDYEGISAL
ncbi:MAG: 2-hydroxyacyl-CoA dehydratase, partial [Angelakisella sp.]